MTGTDWGQRLRDTRDAQQTAAHVHEQTIRDAHATARMSASGIARELGIKNRNRITAVLNPRPDDDSPGPKHPGLPVVIYLRGPGHSDATWTRMRQAMWARGWTTTSDANAAFHLARGGCTLVNVDFAALMDDDPVTVELVRAVYSQPLAEPRQVPVHELLPTAEAVRFERAHPEAAQWPVTLHEDGEQQWKPLAGGKIPRRRVWDETATNNMGQPGAHVLDAQHIARAVADLLE